MVRTRLRTQNQRSSRHVTTPEEEIQKKREAFLAARADYEQAVIENSQPRTFKDDLKSAARMAGHGAVRVTSEIVHRGARVGDAFERDLRRNSLAGDIDRVMVNALFEKNKETSKSSARTKKKFRPVVVEINGKQMVVDQSQVHMTSTRRRRT